EDLAEVAALHELHHDVVLPGDRIAIDGEDRHDIRVPQRQTDLALTLEEGDLLVVLRPAVAKDLDGDTLARARVLSAEDAPEGAAGYSVEELVATQHVAVAIVLLEFAGLPLGDVALALGDAKEVLRGRGFGGQFAQALAG